MRRGMYLSHSLTLGTVSSCSVGVWAQPRPQIPLVHFQHHRLLHVQNHWSSNIFCYTISSRNIHTHLDGFMQLSSSSSVVFCCTTCFLRPFSVSAGDACGFLSPVNKPVNLLVNLAFSSFCQLTVTPSCTKDPFFLVSDISPILHNVHPTIFLLLCL